MSSSPVRVRIAPSPTGYLHVGTARTAILNYLYARHFGGQFLLRIEDTDKERSDSALIQPILSALQWLGMNWDEEIVYQSKKLEQYAKIAGEILQRGHAYRCFCTQEELAAAREKAMAAKQPLHYNRRCLQLSDAEMQTNLDRGMPFVIRLKIPDGETSFPDIVAGNITRQNTEIEDLIIARSDSSATYNLAVVVDDHDMRISHVIRGNDHITNTFKQIHVYRAMEWVLPVFGHVPLILRPDKRKVSKRLGDKDVNEYQREGILPDAMFNYLCLLGWSPKTEREIYTPDELIKLFSPANFNSSNAVFDEDKLLSFNQSHITMSPDEELVDQVRLFFEQSGIGRDAKNDNLQSVVSLLKERVKRLPDFVEQGKYFFEFHYVYDAEAAQKHFTPENAALLRAFRDHIIELTDFDKENLEGALNQVVEENKVKRAVLIHPTRLAVSGVPAGPGLFEMLSVLGKGVVVERLEKAIAYIKTMKTVGK